MGLICLEFRQTHSLPASLAFFESLENGANHSTSTCSCSTVAKGHALLRILYLLFMSYSTFTVQGRLHSTDGGSNLYSGDGQAGGAAGEGHNPIIVIIVGMGDPFLSCCLFHVRLTLCRVEV